jgi:hypothetical protein
MAGLQIPSTARNRLELIEEMIADGRRTTHGWGWPFVLWGVGHLAGIEVMVQLGIYWGWYIIVPACFIASLVALHRNRAGRQTFAGRAIHAVWTAQMIALSIFDLIAMPGRRMTWEGYDLFFLCSMGACTYVTGAVLRWRLCVVLGCVWWAAAVLGLVLPGAHTLAWTWMVTTITLELGFGLYLVIRDARHAGEEA